MDMAKVQSKLAQVEAQARGQEDRTKPLGFDRHWNRFWALGGTLEGHPGEYHNFRACAPDQCLMMGLQSATVAKAAPVSSGGSLKDTSP